MSIIQNAQNLQQMIGEGKIMEALDEYYHDNVRVIEMPNGDIREGKEAQRKSIEEWQGMVQEIHEGGLNSLCADEGNNITTAESWVDVTFKDGNRIKMEEVAVQKWDDGKIVEEKFYYHLPGPSGME